MSYNVDANQFSWYNSYTPTNVVYLAPRTDGISGDGSSFNPLDASTVNKFDAIFSGLQDNTAYYLYPGTYYTNGSTTTRGLRPGISIIGAGMKSTTIKLYDGWNSGEVYFGANIRVLATEADGNPQNYPNIYLRDFTLDCNCNNIPSSTGFKVQGLYVWSDYGIIENVRVMGTSDKYGDNDESFPIYCVGTNMRMKNVYLLQHRRPPRLYGVGNHGNTLLNIAGRNAIAENCVVDMSTSTGYGYCHFFGVNNNTQFLNCFAIGAPSGIFESFYIDSDDINNAIISNCYIQNAYSLFTNNGRRVLNTIFKNNRVFLSTGINARAINGTDVNSSYSGCIFSENIFKASGDINNIYSFYLPAISTGNIYIGNITGDMNYFVA